MTDTGGVETAGGGGTRVARTGRGPVAAVVLLAVLVNLPLLHSTYVDRRIQASGTDVAATVVDDRVVDGDEYWVSFTFPEDVDPDQRTWQAQVDEETYDDAVAADEIRVRVVEGNPSQYRADGTVQSRTSLVVITLVADLLLLVGAVLLFRYRGRSRAPLQAVALGDVERCAPQSLLERIGGEDYLVRGEVRDVEDGVVVLDLGDRLVRVLLDGHRNPVGHQQPAQVRARLVD